MKINLNEKKQLHVELRQVLVFVCHALQMRSFIYVQKSSGVICVFVVAGDGYARGGSMASAKVTSLCLVLCSNDGLLEVALHNRGHTIWYCSATTGWCGYGSLFGWWRFPYGCRIVWAKPRKFCFALSMPTMVTPLVSRPPFGGIVVKPSKP
jgi:hypothetical protein